MTPDILATSLEKTTFILESDLCDEVTRKHALIYTLNQFHHSCDGDIQVLEQKRIVKSFFALATLFLRYAQEHQDRIPRSQLPSFLPEARDLVLPYIDADPSINNSNLFEVRMRIIALVPCLLNTFLESLRSTASMEANTNTGARMGSRYFYDPDHQIIRHQTLPGKNIYLSRQLLKSFELMLSKQNQVVTYADFMSGPNPIAMTAEGVRQNISLIRTAIAPLQPQASIKTFPGKGYMLIIY